MISRPCRHGPFDSGQAVGRLLSGACLLGLVARMLIERQEKRPVSGRQLLELLVFDAGVRPHEMAAAVEAFEVHGTGFNNEGIHTEPVGRYLHAVRLGREEDDRCLVAFFFLDTLELLRYRAFPATRSDQLEGVARRANEEIRGTLWEIHLSQFLGKRAAAVVVDRKSTRLNSSH